MRDLSSWSPAGLIDLLLAGVMRSRTKWVVAGGAAAFVLTPVVAVVGSTALETDLQQNGVIVDAAVANQARAERAAAAAAKAQSDGSAQQTTKPGDKSAAQKKEKAEKAKAEKEKAEKAKAEKAKATTEPTGKKTVPAASPVSQQSPASPVSAD